MLATAFVGALVGVTVDVGYQIIATELSGHEFTIDKLNLAEVGGAAAAGFVGGLTFGLASGAIALAAVGTTEITGGAAVATGAMAGAISNMVGNQSGALVQSSLETNSPLFSDSNIQNAGEKYGYGSETKMYVDAGIGAITGGVIGKLSGGIKGNPQSMIDKPYPIDSVGRTTTFTSRTLMNDLGNKTIVPNLNQQLAKGSIYAGVTKLGNFLGSGVNYATDKIREYYQKSQ